MTCGHFRCKPSASFEFAIEVQAALMATSLSGSFAQTLLRACIWWENSLWAQQSTGVQMCLTPSN